MASKKVTKTPMFFPSQLGRNLSSVPESQLAWLPERYYGYDLGVNDSGSIAFKMGDESYTVEEVTGHLLNFLKGLAVQTVDGVAVSETIITVPSFADMQQRRAVLNAARIAGLPRPQLIHEVPAAALQRALDLDLGGAGRPATNESEATEPNVSTVLFYNMGARHVEACIVRYQGATHQNRNTVSLNVLGCGSDSELGGHQVDIIIADKMLDAFKAKFPKLSGISSDVRALKKLEKQALATKHVLSANKDAQFRVESLYEDTDFMQAVSREDLESWTTDLLARFSPPIEAALAVANVTVDDLDTVEMIGGGWRIPKIQSFLQDYLKEHRSQTAPPLSLSQHVNGDEAMATGSAFYGANSSVSFRTKKIFFTDFTQHGYALSIAPLNASQPHEQGWTRGAELFPAYSKLRAKKTVKLEAKLNVNFDLKATLLQDGNPVTHWELSGIHEAATTGKYSTLASPLISLKLELDGSGVVQLNTAQAIFDEPVPVEVAKPKVNVSESNASDSNATASEEAEAVKEDDAETGNGTGSEDGTAVNATEGQQMKIKKRKVSLTIVEDFDGILPRPMSPAELMQAQERLLTMEKADAEVRKIDAAKNALESYIYDSREKIGNDEGCQQVSTEDQRTFVMEKLTEMEEWMYEEEARTANASFLEGKTMSLEEHVQPILKRAWELEQRALLPELVDKIREGANQTLEYVKSNMTWVAEKELTGVAALVEDFESWYANATELQSKKELTEEPAYEVIDVKRRLERIRSEAIRLTKIKKIDPMPYSSDYDRYGDYWKDPKMRDWYEAYYKNMSRNGSNFSDYFKNFNFSNFSGNGSGDSDDYMRSFRDFYGSDSNESSNGTSEEKPQEDSSKPDDETGKSEL
eukprot:TRINITY_DN74550_c0_g1_i1.p1 TRINITY_DN74550_c0_g1~~TRINITY_DN74550_c0_g1_i1.p1  ORF type:complete len:957 (-),score=215.37 TRINITY_DN74550_c0_g1_i1:325-2928(-)